MNFLLTFTNKNLLIAIFFILFAFSLTFFSLTYFSLNNLSEKIDIIKQTNIKYIFLSKQQTNTWNEFLYLGNSIVFTKIDNPNKRLKLEALMQTSSDFNFKLKKLKDNEAIITYNAANELNLKVGDYLAGDISYLNTAKYYEIKAILDPFFGTFNDPLSDYGLIIIGYDENYELNIDVKYIVFSEAEINELNQNILYSINNLNNIISLVELKTKFIILSIFYHGIFLFLVFILFFIIKKIFGNTWQDYIIFLSSLGHYRTEIILSYSFISFLIVFIPLITGYLFIFLFNLNIIINLKQFIYVFILCVLLTTIWIVFGLNKFNIQARFKHGKFI